MKALCIKKHTSPFMKTHYFTVGKLYTYSINSSLTSYTMTNDEGVTRSLQDWQFKEYFKDIEQIREEKLKELGI